METPNMTYREYKLPNGLIIALQNTPRKISEQMII